MAHWQFRPLNPNENSGASTVDDNFADEERTSVEILVRETLQNPLDARSDSDLVRVCYKLVTIDASSSAFAKAIFSDDWVRHFAAGKLISDKPAQMSFLVIEDFGTTGLEGSYTDSSKDGQTENWNAFWFREGEGAKPTRSNGGAGQGKITLFLASGLRSVFALTRRKSDGLELLFGCCRFKRNYKITGDDRRWAKEARWGATREPEKLAAPITAPSIIAAVKAELDLARADLPGTSFLVPMPIEVTEDSIREAVINEFFFAIRRGRLEVQIGDLVLDAKSIAAAADSLGAGCRLQKNYRDFLELATTKVDGLPTATARENWVKESRLTESAFAVGDVTRLKDAFDLSEPVCVDFPVSVKRKDNSEASVSTFRVILQQDLDADHSQELFVRQDLGIDGEKRLRSSRTIQPVLALTFIQEPKLSDLLVAAEEPTHRNWNAKRPKVISIYTSPDKVLNAVRNAALRLVQLISPEGKRDETALAIYFADPSAGDTKRKGLPGPLPNPINPELPPFPDIPRPKPKPVRVVALKDGFSVQAVANHSTAFPLECQVEVAYATTVGDSYKLWDAADFWLHHEDRFPINSSGVGALEREGNVLSFFLESEESELTISGFDPNRQLDIRVKYKEVAHGADIQNN